ncbi:mannose-1-phosphate guanylyltransferase [Aurantiacibacter xanthus]|uniref:mannose-1-phosphate guanylyltransferase n=1 Tax=Aurantiacibacter xanthus TaxID=1784712 RepID=A0A3A1P6Q0_9SPHN|nr:mannose-1-phosphate guanylyltransferase [Aurantiacibacter xanthus]RIV88570.1 mannose-1-phosphate guanylyltransferase [Aurantiacibacter xanthus]
MTLIHPVILCGGSGTRLWPRSRRVLPKPFVPLVGEQTLFEATLRRAMDPQMFASPTVVTGAAHLAYVRAQLAPICQGTTIVEPEAKNTAPAIALAAQCMPRPDALMLVCPSDHYIADVAAFHEAVKHAAALAGQGHMVAFGITATAPETGFGYIRKGAALKGGYEVERFVEKPDLETAISFLADGNYSWNGGIFAFRADAFLAELAAYRPAMAEAVRASVAAGDTRDGEFYPAAEPFAAIEGDSIDYAVMENTARAAMVPVSMGWSDIGNWQALRDARDGDAQGNRVRGQAELVDCTGVLVETDGPRVNAIGLEDVAIVVDGDEVLVTTMAGAQKVGKLTGAANQ